MRLTRTHFLNMDFQELIVMLDQELWQRYPETQQNFRPFNTLDAKAHIILLYLESAIGCGCFRVMNEHGVVEIKRMFVKDLYRGRGYGKMILSALEKWAVEEGYSIAKLETGINQPEAIAAYEHSGYFRIPNYEPYIHVKESICMMKNIIAY